MTGSTVEQVAIMNRPKREVCPGGKEALLEDSHHFLKHSSQTAGGPTHKAKARVLFFVCLV